LHGIIKQDAHDLLRAQPPPGALIPPAQPGGGGPAGRGSAKRGSQGKAAPPGAKQPKAGKAALAIDQALLAEVCCPAPLLFQPCHIKRGHC
jgi:hypothetical protein